MMGLHHDNRGHNREGLRERETPGRSSMTGYPPFGQDAIVSIGLLTFVIIGILCMYIYTADLHFGEESEVVDGSRSDVKEDGARTAKRGN